VWASIRWDIESHANRMRRPEGIFHVIAEHGEQSAPHALLQ